MNRRYFPLLLAFLALFLAQMACNRPSAETTPTQSSINLIETSAAETVTARLTEMAGPVQATPTGGSLIIPSATLPPAQAPTATQAAATNPPAPTSTNPPAPTATRVPPTPTPIPCNAAQFVKDVTIPDNTELGPGQAFTKTWRLKNVGSCDWTTGYSLVFLSGDAMGGTSADFTERVEPGETVDLSINLTAPNNAGTYKGNWMLRDRDGRFGIGAGASNPFWVQIKVVQAASQGIVYNFATNYCSADWTSGAGDLDCPGKTTDDEGFVIRLDEPDMEHRQENEPGIWTFPEDTNDGYIRGIFPAFRIKDDDRFRADIGCLDDSDDCDVVFELAYRISGGSLDQLGTWHEVSDGEVTRINLDISGLAGHDVEFVLTVRANGSPSEDDAFWLMPQIYRP